jgi:hypothetical protein
MILFKQLYWLSCCHLTFRKILYCLIKTRIVYWLAFTFTFTFHCIMYDVIMKWLISYWLGFTFTFHFNVINQYEYLWTLEINIHLSLKAWVNIVFKIHKNSHWRQQKTIIVYYCPYWYKHFQRNGGLNKILRR